MTAERRPVRELIEEGLRDTERLISQKQYNLSMIRSRQTLEHIVKKLCRKNGIEEGELMDMIDDLYRKGAISRENCANFHKIRILGNKAAHEGDNNAYNANNSYHLLEQAVYSARSLSPQRRPKRPSARQGSARRRRSSGRRVSPALLRAIVLFLAILLALSLIRLFRPGAKKNAESTESIPPSTEAPTEETESAPAPEAAKLYTTTASLNVRSAPTTEGDLLTTLPAGTVLDYVGPHDDQWSIINYNGGQAYVASQYINVTEIPAGAIPAPSAAPSGSPSSEAPSAP